MPYIVTVKALSNNQTTKYMQMSDDAFYYISATIDNDDILKLLLTRTQVFKPNTDKPNFLSTYVGDIKSTQYCSSDLYGSSRHS